MSVLQALVDAVNTIYIYIYMYIYIYIYVYMRWDLRFRKYARMSSPGCTGCTSNLIETSLWTRRTEKRVFFILLTQMAPTKHAFWGHFYDFLTLRWKSENEALASTGVLPRALGRHTKSRKMWKKETLGFLVWFLVPLHRFGCENVDFMVDLGVPKSTLKP